ncbi:MAG: hypothetical protein WBE26_09930 [Phycisphaerae bacterium]
MSVVPTAFAQSPAARPARPAAFARYVPASARLFVTIRRLGEVDEALHRAHAWGLAPLLSGRPADEGKPFDLRGAITSFLGPRTSIDIDELMQAEMGLVARSWSQVSRPVWLVRIRDESVLDRWFPPAQRSMKGAMGPVRFFRTREGVIVCTRDGIVAMARRWGPDSLLQEVMDLMADRGGDVLESSATFKGLMAYLPVDRLAVAYAARDDTSAADGVELSPWWPTVDRAVIGLYEGQGRLDVAVRASLAAPHRAPKLSPAAMERLLRLPQTTLFAFTTTIDFDCAYDAATMKSPSGALGRYLVFLAGMRKANDTPSEPPSRFGPHVILVLGQDLTESGLAPQPAIMVECSDGRAVRDFVRQVAERIIQLTQAIDPAQAPHTLTVERSVHLGVPIWHVPLEAYAQRSKLPFMNLLGSVEPAWAIWNGWLILTVSRDHLERILDAQYGLVPALATVRDVRALRKRSAERAVLSIVQPGLATDVLEQWLTAYKNGAPSLLDPIWWRGGSGSASRKRPQVGIGMKLVQEPGVVTVARVYQGTPAAGRLQPDDRILGIDGHLLGLTSPNADLRRRWAESTAKPGPTLRVLRSGTAVDVVLPKQREEALWSNIRVKPADAVRELASLGRTLEFASFEVLATDEKHYSGRLSLRLAPVNAAEASGDRQLAVE